MNSEFKQENGGKIMDKKWYTMYLSAEEQACGNVLLTENEAKIVKV